MPTVARTSTRHAARRTITRLSVGYRHFPRTEPPRQARRVTRIASACFFVAQAFLPVRALHRQECLCHQILASMAAAMPADVTSADAAAAHVAMHCRGGTEGLSRLERLHARGDVHLRRDAMDRVGHHPIHLNAR